MSDQQELAITESAGSDEKSSSSENVIQLLPPADVFDILNNLDRTVATTILDPWYNKGVGGVKEGYDGWLINLVELAAKKSNHLFVWGFPYIIYKVLDHVPPDYELVDWLVWFYKNCPSVIQGWRSAHNACLHLAREDTELYPEHFLNEKQLEKKREGKLRYMPGPPNVIEAPLNIGFVGREEQTGHPAQKPEKVFAQLIKMTTVPGDTVLDPMCGSGTTGAVCWKLDRNAILCDVSEECYEMTKNRLLEDGANIRC